MPIVCAPTCSLTVSLLVLVSATFTQRPDFVGAFSVATYTQSASHRNLVVSYRVEHICFTKNSICFPQKKKNTFPPGQPRKQSQIVTEIHVDLRELLRTKERRRRNFRPIADWNFNFKFEFSNSAIEFSSARKNSEKQFGAFRGVESQVLGGNSIWLCYQKKFSAI